MTQGLVKENKISKVETVTDKTKRLLKMWKSLTIGDKLLKQIHNQIAGSNSILLFKQHFVFITLIVLGRFMTYIYQNQKGQIINFFTIKRN